MEVDEKNLASAVAGREEELIALESIFDTDFKKLSENAWAVTLTPEPNPSSVEFHFVPAARCLYPLQLPIIIYRCNRLSAHQRLHVVQAVARWCVQQRMLGTAMVHLIAEQ